MVEEGPRSSFASTPLPLAAFASPFASTSDIAGSRSDYIVALSLTPDAARRHQQPSRHRSSICHLRYPTPLQDARRGTTAFTQTSESDDSDRSAAPSMLSRGTPASLCGCALRLNVLAPESRRPQASRSQFKLPDLESAGTKIHVGPANEGAPGCSACADVLLTAAAGSGRAQARAGLEAPRIRLARDLLRVGPGDLSPAHGPPAGPACGILCTRYYETGPA